VAGFTTLLQAWDFRPGTDFVHQMQQAVQQADRTIAVVSSEYFGSQFGEAEWRVAFGRDPTGESGVLVPVRVEDLDPPGLLSTRVYVDLVGLDEATARRRLLADLRPEADRPRRPATARCFPAVPPRRRGFDRRQSIQAQARRSATWPPSQRPRPRARSSW